MNDTKKRLNPENKNSTKDNYIFGNINGVVDYHHIENYSINGVSIKDHIILRDDRINALELKLEALESKFDELLEQNKQELLGMIHEIIKSKVV